MLNYNIYFVYQEEINDNKNFHKLESSNFPSVQKFPSLKSHLMRDTSHKVY